MNKDTKELIYMLLDIVDAFNRTSAQSDFIKIDTLKLTKVKNELFDLMMSESSSNVKDEINMLPHLIGTLPFILVDKTKFSSNNDIVKFAERSLGLEIPSWEKKSREEIIGRFISQIAAKQPSELETFFKIWNKFNIESSKKNSAKKTSSKKANFVDTWLNFFEKNNSM